MTQKPTIRGVFQLSAHHTSICIIPKVNTDGAPTTIDTQLNSSIWPEVTPTISGKAQCTTSTWSYGSVSVIGSYNSKHQLCKDFY